jgi:hypothetical protein
MEKSELKWMQKRCSDLAYAMGIYYRHEKQISALDWREMFDRYGITTQDLRRVRKYARVNNYPKAVIRAMIIA